MCQRESGELHRATSRGPGRRRARPQHPSSSSSPKQRARPSPMKIPRLGSADRCDVPKWRTTAAMFHPWPEHGFSGCRHDMDNRPLKFRGVGRDDAPQSSGFVIGEPPAAWELEAGRRGVHRAGDRPTGAHATRRLRSRRWRCKVDDLLDEIRQGGRGQVPSRSPPCSPSGNGGGPDRITLHGAGHPACAYNAFRHRQRTRATSRSCRRTWRLRRLRRAGGHTNLTARGARHP